MLVNYFCGVADRLKSLARQAQVTDPADSSHWLGRLKSLARQTQGAGTASTKRPAPQGQAPALLHPPSSTPSPQYSAAGR